MTTAWKLVDDTDSRIQYSGVWDLDSSGAQNKVSRTGDVFNNTFHSATANGTSFTFRFNGSSSLGVFGTYDTTLGYPSGNSSAIVDCYLDGKRLFLFDHLATMEEGITTNNQLICRADPGYLGGDVSPGEHELYVVNINATALANDGSPSPLVLFDYIVYESMPDEQVDGETVQLGNLLLTTTKDPHLFYSLGWDSDNSMMSTVDQGAWVKVKFNGTAIQFFGEIQANDSSTMFSYTLDNQDPVLLPLSDNKTSGDPVLLSNQKLFDLSSLSPNEHELVISLNHSGRTPLTVDYLLVTSLTKEEQAAQLSSSGSSSGGISIGMIVGLVLGCVGIFFLVGFFTLFSPWLRQRSRKKPKPAVKLGHLISPFRSHDTSFSYHRLSPEGNDRYYSKSSRKLESPSSSRSHTDPSTDATSGSGSARTPDAEQTTLGNSLGSSRNLAEAEIRDQIPSGHYNVSEGEGQVESRSLTEGSLQSPQMFVHTDSGLRFQDRDMDRRNRILELPPDYTPE